MEKGMRNVGKFIGIKLKTLEKLNLSFLPTKNRGDMMLKCIKREKGYSLTVGKVYPYEKYTDGFGEYYSILDDSGDWYRYSKEIVERFFIIIKAMGY